MTTRPLLIATALLLSTGCGAVKGALKPWVCDCEPATEQVCADGTVPVAATEQPILQQNSEDPSVEAEETEEEVAESTAPRTTVDPFINDAAVTPASPGWPQLVESVRLPSELPASSEILRGDFDRRGSIEAVLLVPSKTVAIYGEGRRKLETELLEDFANEAIAKLWGRPVGAAQLVRDDVSEVLVFGLDTSGEIEVVTFSVYKVFGDRIGRVFTTEVGKVGAEGVTKTAEIEFLGGRRHIGIRRTPLDSSGVPDPGRAEVFEWNKWEGMFRTPKPPPTAPARS